MSEIILVSAFLLDLILGEPPTKFHPTVWMGSYIQRFWKICPKGSKKIEFLWGTLLILSGVFLFAGLMIIFSSVFSSYSLLFLFLSIPLLKASFSVRSLITSGYHIKKELESGNLSEARRLTSYHLVSRNTETLTEEEICSCVIESLSENITDSFSSPILYFLLFGLPGSWAYRLVNTSDSMIAYRNEEFEWGGKFTAWCDTGLNWIPARISAGMILVGAFLFPGASFRKSYQCLMRERKKTASPNAGWTMSAMAGALGVILTKNGEYTLNGGSSPLNSKKIDICLKITVLSLMLTMVVLIVLIRGGLWALNMVG